ncbi:MAG: hypothetical protein LQ346_008989 [Caloplaca aetnensis]|nr:MAG: hypothetical protein LQ346_008989 [Caloplaca aetnensis]
MWLLDTLTLKLKNFVTHYMPPYAILSHTWGIEEVSFQDMDKPESKTMKGYQKIERCCSIAYSQGYGYVWIDTCCIDKKSSAELSEAINSMYAWYAGSSICFVYLSDFDTPTWDEHTKSEVMEKFRKSRWWSRGWTLQELLAPKYMKFYASNWEEIGGKSSLFGQLSLASGIPPRFIQDGESIYEASVAARMSWASNRETTRLEDEAYSLMGIFDVNMPLLYGEGRKAFTRLQHEIARSLDDESLFAWSIGELQSGIFAPNVHAFAGCGAIRSLWVPNMHRMKPRQASAITNRGLQLEAVPRRLPASSIHGSASLPKDALKYDYALLPLNCARKGSENKPFTIILRRISHNQYVRFLPGECMVYEKYIRYVEWERDGHNDAYYPDMIFIKDPPRAEIPSIWSHALTIDNICASSNRSSYRLKEWYLSSPGIITDSWSILFLGWSGFAVLRFEDRRQQKPSFFIICRNVHTAGAKRAVKLEILNGLSGSTVANTVDYCYSDHDLLAVVPDSPEKQTVLSGAGEEISLSRLANARITENTGGRVRVYTDYLLTLPV